MRDHEWIAVEVTLRTFSFICTTRTMLDFIVFVFALTVTNAQIKTVALTGTLVIINN